ncbi:MAG: DNA polymerase IV [Clostridia bacterium]
MKKILHLDIDAFYASVEQLDNPRLRGKPVIVGGRENRGVVATCSYEARKYGVRSAMPIALARKKCPEGIYLPVRYARYEEKSAEIRAVFQRYSPLYQTVGLDEAYLDVSQFENAVPVAREIKHRIKQECGLTCSIGLSYNMSLAKIASDLKKPDAFVIIRPEEALDVLRTLPIGAIHGIGKKSQELLAKRNITTVEQFWQLSEDEIVKLFGKMGQSLYQRVRGIDHREIDMDRTVKSISRETTLPFDIQEKEQVLQVAKELLQELKNDLQEQAIEHEPHTLTLKIKYSDFTNRSKQRRKQPGASWEDLLEELVDAIDAGPGIRLVGVGFSGLHDPRTEDERYEQLTMFSILHEV